jgi:hypothetical protein
MELHSRPPGSIPIAHPFAAFAGLACLVVGANCALALRPGLDAMAPNEHGGHMTLSAKYMIAWRRGVRVGHVVATVDAGSVRVGFVLVRIR